MDLIYLTKLDEIKNFSKEYTTQVTSSFYSPELITFIDIKFFSEELYSTDKLGFLADDSKIKLVSFLEDITADDFEDLDAQLGFRINPKHEYSKYNPFKKYKFEKNLTYIKKVESLEKNKGYGKTFLDKLKHDSFSEGIFLYSKNRATNFYLKNGFIDSGLSYCSMPILGWNK